MVIEPSRTSNMCPAPPLPGTEFYQLKPWGGRLVSGALSWKRISVVPGLASGFTRTIRATTSVSSADGNLVPSVENGCPERPNWP